MFYYEYAKFTNYIGFYNGMGLTEVELDFGKKRNHITLIVGMNGSGKSTLINALSVFPDNSSSYIPGANASKVLFLSDRINKYAITITSAANSNGSRKPTKASIVKNGMELNENGNISSYKDIIFSEFELDPNFISLSSLAFNDRGLGDKTPSERKAYVSRIVDNLGVYNDIYKTLNKKSTIFKSHVNTLHTKIQNIGNRESLQLNLSALENRLTELNAQYSSLHDEKTVMLAKNSFSEEDLAKINGLTEEKSRIEKELKHLINNREEYKIKNGIPNEETGDTTKLVQEKSDYEDKLNTTNYNISLLKTNISSINGSIREMKAVIDSTEIPDLFDNHKAYIDKQRTTLDNLLSNSNNKLHYTPDIETVDDDIAELTRKINWFTGFKSGLDALADAVSSVQYFEFFVPPFNYSTTLREELEEKRKIKNKIESDLSDYETDYQKMTMLKLRPDGCKFDNCHFLNSFSDVWDKYKSVEEVGKLVEEANNQLKDIKNEIEARERSLDEAIRNDDIFRRFDSEYLRSLHENTSFKNNIPLLHSEKVISYIQSTSLFKINDDIEEIVDLFTRLKNTCVEFKELYKLVKSYEDKFKAYESTIKIREKAENSINEFTKQLKDNEDKLKSETNIADVYKDHINALTDRIVTLDKYREFFKAIEDTTDKLNRVSDELSVYQEKNDKYKKLTTEIPSINERLAEIESHMSPIKSDISRLTGQIVLIDQYMIEYNEYESKYNTIEILRKYCSPTTGIQNIFMQLYMSKTLSLCNQLLGFMFNGAYQLGDFIINDKEFRIPFIINGGMTVDDISSGSASQIAMMGSIINLALIQQASSKFKIPKLDEVDSGLDSMNRSQFFTFLDTACNMLGITQMFAISHSIEADASNVDIIKLKNYEDFDINHIAGNVIWDYKDHIQ